ncbi:MAG TPA: hypothetical protein VMZ26_10485, partial [Pyrinomonadaceae bacterium]|nr:hypothetical protein [Pyrinomonadaceae bacterium]
FTSAAYSTDGERIITGLQDGSLRTWGATTGTELSRSQIGENVSFLNRIGTSKKVVALVRGPTEKRFKIIEPSTGDVLSTSRPIDLTYVETVSVSGDGQYLIVVDNIGTVEVWTLSDLMFRRRLQYEYSGGDAVAFSPDSKTFYIGGDNQNVLQYESATGRKLWQLLADFKPAESETRLIAEKDKRVSTIIEAKKKRDAQAAIDVAAFRTKVYVKFDHYGSMSDPGNKRIVESDEPAESKVTLPRNAADAVWLRLFNDSPLPIKIPTQSMYFPNPKCVHVFPTGEKIGGLCERREISIWHGLEDRTGKSVRYGFDFGSSAILLPNSSVVFPVPLAILRNGNSIVFGYSFQNVKASVNDDDWDYGEKLELRFGEKNLK